MRAYLLFKESLEEKELMWPDAARERQVKRLGLRLSNDIVYLHDSNFKI